MTNEQLPPEVEKKLDNIIAQNEGVSTLEVDISEQNKFIGGFSLGALVYGVFYFAFMRDRLYVILSIVFGLIFPPLLLALALNARRRAWESKKWINYNQYLENQKLWDKAGLYGIIIMLIISWYVLKYIYSMLIGLVPNNGGTDLQQLNELQSTLQSTLGN